MFNLDRIHLIRRRSTRCTSLSWLVALVEEDPQKYRLVTAIIADGCWLLQPGFANSVVSQWLIRIRG